MLDRSRADALLALRDHSAFHNLCLCHRGAFIWLNRALMSSISPYIRELLFADPHLSRVDIPPFPGNLDDFRALIYGYELRIHALNCWFLSFLGRFFRISTLENAADEVLRDAHMVYQVVLRAEALISNFLPANDEVDRLASQFGRSISQYVFSSMSLALLEAVLNSPFLPSPDKNRNSVIIAMLELDARKYEPLMHSLDYRTLDLCLRRRLFSIESGINLNLIKSSLHPIIRHSSLVADNRQHFPVRNPLEFDGLIRFFMSHEQWKSDFTLSVGSESPHPFNSIQLLALDDKYSYFASDSGPFEFVQFAFNRGTIRLTHYALRGWVNAKEGVCPVSWTVKISEDGVSWSEVDRRICDNSLMSAEVVVFELSRVAGPANFIRVEQQATGNPENVRLVLSGMDFYGIWNRPPGSGR
jgi:hypothetical protein